MPTQDKDSQNTVSLVIDGKIHSAWSRYQIDSDFLIPSDAWSVTLGLPDGIFPPAIKRGVPVLVRVGNDVVMSGRVDVVQRRVSRQQALYRFPVAMAQPCLLTALHQFSPPASSVLKK